MFLKIEKTSLMKTSYKFIDNFSEAATNIRNFSKVGERTDTITYRRFSRFFHWYFLPDAELFGPSKFIGYKTKRLKQQLNILWPPHLKNSIKPFSSSLAARSFSIISSDVFTRQIKPIILIILCNNLTHKMHHQIVSTT